MPTYNPWPLGKLPEDFRRPEIQQLRDAGYKFDDPREANTIFEDKLSKFTGAPYVILTDNCTNALFLILHYLNLNNFVLEPTFRLNLPNPEFGRPRTLITIPKKTYLSVPQSITHAGFDVKFQECNWSGMYSLKPLNVWDAAVRFTQNMYIPQSFMALSFQIKKRLPIGKGGAILCDDRRATHILRQLSFEGRDLNVPYDQDKPIFPGFNMYMTPEDAARGILLFDKITQNGAILDFPDTGTQDNYQDLTNQLSYIYPSYTFNFQNNI